MGKIDKIKRGETMAFKGVSSDPEPIKKLPANLLLFFLAMTIFLWIIRLSGAMTGLDVSVQFQQLIDPILEILRWVSLVAIPGVWFTTDLINRNQP